VGLFDRSSNGSGGFDEATIVTASGELRRFTKDEFDNLALPDRIRAILNKSVKFFRAGREVPIKEALGDRY
jgi:hypothetical protein